MHAIDRLSKTLKIYAKYGFFGDGQIGLDATSACQLRCPVCVDVWQLKKKVGIGML